MPVLAPPPATTGKDWFLSPRQEDFCRLVALKGKSLSDAYRLSYDYSGSNADVLGNQLHRQTSGVADRIAELRKEAHAPQLLDMRERRGLLAKIVRHEQAPIDPPTYAERMKAAELDAKFTGELRSDGVNIALHGPVSIDVVLNQLRNAEHNKLDKVSPNPEMGGGGGKVLPIQSVDCESTVLSEGGPPVGPGVGPQDQVADEAIREPLETEIPKKATNVKRRKSVKTVKGKKGGDVKGISSSGESGNGDSGDVVSPVIVRGPLGVLGG